MTVKCVKVNLLMKNYTGKITMSQIEIKKYDFIDALRGWAIVGVILLHVSAWVIPDNSLIKLIVAQGGNGVGLFFVASSLTLFLSMSARNQQESQPILKYFIRRFFRIAPLFYFAMILFSIILPDVGTYTPNGKNFHHYFLTVFFLHGWFPDTINAIVPGGWSISTEMMFYLLVPVIFTKLNSLYRAIYLLVITIIIAKSVNYFTWNYFNDYFYNQQNLVYEFQTWWIIAQMPVFVIGILLFLTIKELKEKKIDKRLGTALLFFAMLLFLSFTKSKSLFDIITSYYYYAFAFYIFGLSLYINPSIFFVNRITKFIGKYSFSLYITHFAVLVVLKKYYPTWNGIVDNLSFIAVSILVFLLSLGVSVITYNFIEKPGIRLGKFFINRI